MGVSAPFLLILKRVCMSTKLQLINSALILIGDLPLDSLVGTTRAHVVTNALYDNIVQNELSKFRWGFARKQAQLSKAFQPSASGSPSNPVVWGVFDGATINGDVYTFPSSAASYAGFYNENVSLFPFDFSTGGTLSFTGAIPAGGVDVSLNFKFEANPFPDIVPFFVTDSITVTGEAEATYTVTIPDQGNNTFNSFLMFLETRDAGVIIKDVTITSDVAVKPSFNYSNVYRAPSDLLTLITLSPSVNYQVYSDDNAPGSTGYQNVFVNHSGDLFCDYIYNVSESDWPVYFSKMVEYALGMDFAPAIRDSAVSMELLANQYQNASRMARFTDSQQHPQTPIQSRPFIDVRR
jgi:hypothetical protein